MDICNALELVRVLAERDYKHVELFKKIKFLLLRLKPEYLTTSNLKYVGLYDPAKEKMTPFEVTSAFVNEFQSLFLKLKFYETQLFDFMIDTQMKQVNNLIEEKKSAVDVIEMMLYNLIFFQHNRGDVAEFLLDAKFDSDKESLSYTEGFPADLFLIYAGFIKFKK
jgi:hypothetical protein